MIASMLAVLLIGMLQPVQAGMNATLRDSLSHPLQSGIWNMYGGAIAITLVALVKGVRPPLPSELLAAPGWSLAGGLIGATLVTTMLITAPKLGVGLMVAVFVVGQVLSSTIIDQFGWLNFDVRAINPGRAIGMLLVAAGVVVVWRSS